MLKFQLNLKWVKIICFTTVFLVLAGGLFLTWVYFVMQDCAKNIYQSPDAVPLTETALLLGTAQKTPRNTPNLYFRGRIKAAAQLYHAGRIKHILISGDNSRKGYNEPEDMKQALLAAGIPESAMTLDYAGFRTLDSVIRAKNVFQLDRCLIITQEYHAVRALYIARKSDLQAAAFAAEDIQIQSVKKKNHRREKFARVLAWFDMNILHTSPRFPQ